MKRENVAKLYMVKKLAKTKKTAFTEHFWLKIGTQMAMSHHPNGLITLVWALINQLSTINRLR